MFPPRLPGGSSRSAVDLLIDASNPGDRMLHCHIAGHLGAELMPTMPVR